MSDQADDAPFALTDLGERLAGEDGAELAGRHAARLEALSGRIAAEIARGVPMGRLDDYKAVAAGLAVARSLMLGAQGSRAT